MQMYVTTYANTFLICRCVYFATISLNLNELNEQKSVINWYFLQSCRIMIPFGNKLSIIRAKMEKKSLFCHWFYVCWQSIVRVLWSNRTIFTHVYKELKSQRRPQPQSHRKRGNDESNPGKKISGHICFVPAVGEFSFLINWQAPFDGASVIVKA